MFGRIVSVGVVVLFAACGGSDRTGQRDDGRTRAPSQPSAQPEAPSRSATTGFVAVHRPSDESLLEAPARALSGEGALEQIAATYPLRVVRVRAQAGDSVRAGAPIVEVTSAEILGAAARYQGATENLAIVLARLEAVRGLREQRVASAEQVFDLEARAAELRGTQRESLATLRAAGLDAASAASVLSRGTIILSSHEGGVVRNMEAIAGEVHPNGQVFATIVTGPSRRVEARFPRLLGEGFRFEFEDLLGNLHPLGDHPSRVLEAGEEGGVIVWFDLPQGVDLPPQAPGHVHAIPVRETLVEVPIGALHPTADGAEVIRRRDGTTARVGVHVIAASGTSAVVEGDVRIGDDVAADAASELDQPAPEEP